MKYNLQFFAQEGPGGEKTEEPTAKKLDDARKEGQVAKSQEANAAILLMGLFLSLKIFIGYIGNGLLEQMNYIFNNIDKFVKDDFNRNVAATLLQDGLITIVKIAAPVFLIGLVFAFVINIFQVKWKITWKPLKPKGNKINPISGFKKIISKDKIFDLLKAIAKIGIISIVVFSKLKDEWKMLYLLYDMELQQGVLYIGNLVIDLGLTISAVYLILGLADYIYQKFKFKKDMRMTKQEIKDEYKQTEGDPQIKGRIKQKMREVSQKRMMQSLPEADVVITNPTHYACAIKYDKDVSDAPILLAKGADILAAKIKDIAKENKVEIVENKPLARMLYYNVDVGDQIPPELYQMTAEVLAYVYGLKGNSTGM